MNATGRHIIQSVCFDANAGDEAAAAAFADAIAATDYEALFGKVLDPYNDIQETIRIDKVELDIGEIDVTDIDAINAGVARQLAAVLAGNVTVRYAASAKSVSYPERNQPLENTPTTNEQRVDMIFNAERNIEIVLHFFDSGLLPWNVSGQPDIESLLIAVLDNNSGIFRPRILPNLNNHRFIRRMVITLKYETIKRLVKKIAGDEDFTVLESVTAIFENKIPGLPHAMFEKQIAEIYLTTIGKGSLGMESLALAFVSGLLPVLKQLPALAAEQVYTHIQQLLRNTDNSPVAAAVYKTLAGRQQEFVPLPEAPGKIPIHYEAAAEVALITEKGQTKNPAGAHIEERNILQPQDNKRPSGVERSHFFIDNSGLVLLNAALLQKGFERLGWVSDRTIPDEYCRNKIMLWLDYLVWGERKVHEYGLTLNKVLAGIAPAEIADTSPGLTGEEMNEGDELLRAVIQYWTILKNTSVNAFRESFLQRNGKLSNEDGGWQLHVESRGLDILIDYLPWSFSIIKYPWMDKPLFTQWQTKA